MTKLPKWRMWRIASWTIAIALLAAPLGGSAQGEDLPATVEFNRDIRPILSDTCFHCHGPDSAQRKADLRFDQQADALADRGGYAAIVPGEPAKSELYRRITSDDATQRMPPADSGRQLSDRQIELLRRWIEQGAKWQKHWSLLPPVRPEPPTVGQPAWVRNAIDAFVLARLEQEGLSPSPEAEKTTLIRRLSLDLTGLPPTPEEVDAFLADKNPNAYEHLIDRLLASPRYGERMAARWLDAARYADTNGYQSDGVRSMWRWRDWVIEAYNRNLPFDEFTIEQLAGDLLPRPTLQQRIATGFNRNHRGNAEGGIIPEEYAVEYVADRVETTSTVWLGLTVGCARCHDHKYDPISQKEFYRLFAYFNNVPERGKAVKFGNSPPMIPAPTNEQQAALKQLEGRLSAAEATYKELEPRLAASLAEWEASLSGSEPLDWTFRDGLVAEAALDGNCTISVPEESSDSETKTTVSGGDLTYVSAPFGQAANFDGQSFLDAGNLANFGFHDKFSCSAWVRMEQGVGGTILSRMTDVEQGDGYSFGISGGKLQVNLVKRWLDDALRIESAEPVGDGWHHLMFTYDGSRVAGGIRLYVDGSPAPTRVLLDDLNQSFASKEPLRIGAGNGPQGRFRGQLAEVRVYADALKAEHAQLVATRESIAQIVGIDQARRTAAQANKLKWFFLERQAPEPIRQAWQNLLAMCDEREELIESFPTVMVMQELPQPRESFVLLRGQYDKPGEQVTAGVPASLSPLPDEAPPNRLGLAQWLVDPRNPLTARVAVNRFWQMYFGTGLVKTVDDFGSQGESPSHPELLDWLATEFVRTGWDIKALQRTIVTSATYRQTSRTTPELLRKDPDNRLLARGPRFRLSAEAIRDQALLASGLLVEKIGGPSVKPYQPPGLWKELTGGEDYVADHAENLYRRSLYTFWKRTVAPPTMLTFDASGRETCSVRQTRTNTPLQALVLMNETTFVEAARKLAERVLLEAEPSPDARLELAFRLVLSRLPEPREREILLAGLNEHLATYRANESAALALVSIGESPRNEKLDVAELAAYAAMSGLILNLDEAITKE